MVKEELELTFYELYLKVKPTAVVDIINLPLKRLSVCHGVLY